MCAREFNLDMVSTMHAKLWWALLIHSTYNEQTGFRVGFFKLRCQRFNSYYLVIAYSDRIT